MPIAHCQCWECDEERGREEPDREPAPDEVLAPPQRVYGYSEDENGDEIETVHENVRIHATCRRCGHRQGGYCTCIECGACGSLMNRADRHTCRRCGETTCINPCRCVRQSWTDQALVHSYSHVPGEIRYRRVTPASRLASPRFNVMRGSRYPLAPDAEPYLGMELEWEAPDAPRHDIAWVWADSRNGWTTSDSSLRTGAESKTWPTTYAYLARCNLADTLQGMVAAGGRSFAHDTTGLHTHVSRRAFRSKSHEYVFTWLQVVAFREQCLQLAARTDTHYCEWPERAQPVTTLSDADPTLTFADLDAVERTTYLRNIRPEYLRRLPREYFDRQGERFYVPGYDHAYLMAHFRTSRRPQRPRPNRNHPLKVIVGKLDNNNRSVAVNVGHDTLELRYWKGTLSSDAVLGQCALIDALIRYSHGLRVSAKTKDQVHWDAFGDWCIDYLPASQVTHIATLCATRAGRFIRCARARGQ